MATHATISTFRPPDRVTSRLNLLREVVVRPLNRAELSASLKSLPGVKPLKAATPGIEESLTVSPFEVAIATATNERSLRSLWKKHRGNGKRPLLLIAENGNDSACLVLGPSDATGPVREVSLADLLAVLTDLKDKPELKAIRGLTLELERLDQTTVAGLKVNGLGTVHLYRTRLREEGRETWDIFGKAVEGISGTNWKDVFSGLGYKSERDPRKGYLLRFNERPVVFAHAYQDPADFIRIDRSGRPPDGALINDCRRSGADFGVLVAGSRIRLFWAKPTSGSATGRYLELDADALQGEDRPLLGLLSPDALAKGKFEELLEDARNYGAKLSDRVDTSLRQRVLPILGIELGRWAKSQKMDIDDEQVQTELERAALTFVFRAIFLLYAESSRYLPIDNVAYSEQSLRGAVNRAHEAGDKVDPNSKQLWRRFQNLVEAMRDGNKAWNVPAYNGALFARDRFDGAGTLEKVELSDTAMARILTGLGIDSDTGDGIDYSDIDVRHLGHIYEGLLSLRLSVADRSYRYDSKRDRYIFDDDDPEITPGELVWLTNEGGRKASGVYYTPEPLVRHLVKNSVVKGFESHLKKVAELAESNPEEAAEELLDFKVLDPACGSAHFLVTVIDDLADLVAEFLAKTPLPKLREHLDELRARSGSFATTFEDAALLRRLILKKCVYGVDISPMGAEIAKVSLWLASFVPGLALSYLDRNIVVGNSLVGVANRDQLQLPNTIEGETIGQVGIVANEMQASMDEAAAKAAEIADIDDSTAPGVELAQSRQAEIEVASRKLKTALDIWTAEPFGIKGARVHILSPTESLDDLVTGFDELDEVNALTGKHTFLHWPLAFPEVFTRDNPGFDAVVGNPPWEEVKVEELGFFVPYDPGVKFLAEKDRNARIKKIKEERPELVDRFKTEKRDTKHFLRFFTEAGGYESSKGDPDLYKFFTQRYRHLLRGRGYLAVVLPRTVFINQGSSKFRRWLFQNTDVERVDLLLNNKLWIFDTHPQYTVALLTAVNASAETNVSFRLAGVAKSEKEFFNQSQDKGTLFDLSQLGPDFEVPIAPNKKAYELLNKVRKGGYFPLGAGDRWKCCLVREFDESLDKALWQGAATGRPLWKGSSFSAYAPHGNNARICPASDASLKKASKKSKRPGEESLIADLVPVERRIEATELERTRARIAIRLVGRKDDSKTLIACLVPPNVFLVNSAPYLVFPEGTDFDRMACLGLMNSLVLNWQVRRFTEANMNNFILELLTLPKLDDKEFQEISRSAARLSCVDERFEEFAENLGVDYGPLAEGERNGLLLDIDARTAKAWELNPRELEIVLDDFNEKAVPVWYAEELRKKYEEIS